MVLEKILESPLDCKEIQPVHPKGNQSWIVIGRTDAEAETPTLWLPAAKSRLIGKDPDAGKDWGEEEKGMTEAKMALRVHPLSASHSNPLLGHVSHGPRVLVNPVLLGASISGIPWISSGPSCSYLFISKSSKLCLLFPNLLLLKGLRRVEWGVWNRGKFSLLLREWE